MNRALTLVITSLIATTAFTVDSMRARADARGGVTDSYCKDPTTQKAVVTAMNRQHIMAVKVHGVRFIESVRDRGFCAYDVTSSTGSTLFWVTPLPSQGGAPRFTFEQLD